MVLSLLKGEKGIEYPGSSQDTRNMHTSSNRNEFFSMHVYWSRNEWCFTVNLFCIVKQ